MNIGALCGAFDTFSFGGDITNFFFEGLEISCVSLAKNAESLLCDFVRGGESKSWDIFAKHVDIKLNIFFNSLAGKYSISIDQSLLRFLDPLRVV